MTKKQPIKKSDQSDILRDAAVFDYVSGTQSDSARMEFEQKLQHDTVLQQQVAWERSLREQLDPKNAQTPPVSMSNLDSLMERIDETEVTQETFVDSQKGQNISWFNKPLFPAMSIAAGLAVVCVISVGLFQGLTQPQFTTLSSPSASAKVDFSQLVEQRRLAKVVLHQDYLDVVSTLLDDYGLIKLDQAGLSDVIMVIASEEIAFETLAAWRADVRIKEVNIVAFGDEN